MAAADPRAVIAAAPMHRRQIAAIAVCILLNALDGFDILSISFAAPGIAADWHVNRAALGIVLSMELIGMAAGSIALGRLCDRIGRRPTVLLCLAIMATGMALAATAGGVRSLSAFRLLTGFGIGGMLAVTAAIVAEVANARSRSTAVALMAGGYPAGAVVGGTIASLLLVGHSWRAVFWVGGGATLACLPLALAALPETVAWLLKARPANAFARVDRAMSRLGHRDAGALPPPDVATISGGHSALFGPRLAPVTLLLTLAYFAHILTFYFLLKWIPKIVVDIGFAPAAAGGVLVWTNGGGVIGAVVLSLLLRRFPLKPLVLAAMGCAAAAVTVFGQAPADLRVLSVLAAIAGGCTNAGVVGLYALFVQTFPTDVRSSGTGFVIGIGRGGAALSPIMAGALFAAGVALPGVAAIMATGSLIGLAALAALRPPPRAAVPIGAP